MRRYTRFRSTVFQLYYIGISSMQNILEWGDKSGPLQKSIYEKEKGSKIWQQIIMCSIFVES